MKVTGTVRFQDLEGGLWFLEADDGESYALEGGDAGLRKKGQRVEITGKVQGGGGFGIGQTGAATLKVKNYTVL